MHPSSNKIDLNRDFPDRFAETGTKPRGNEQPETQVLMDWSTSVGFTGSAAMHEARVGGSGGLCAAGSVAAARPAGRTPVSPTGEAALPGARS